MIGWVRHVKYIGERSSSPDVLPTNTLAPSIAGDPYVGEVLTATPGTWTGADSVSGEWYVDGVATGDTDTSYTVLLADAGKVITYVETATNASGSRTKASNAITIPPVMTIELADGNLYARFPWSATHDAVQRIAVTGASTTANGCVQPTGCRRIPIATAREGMIAAFNAAIIAAGDYIYNQSDDSAPVNYNDTFIAGSHGPTAARQIVATAHGKTLDDVGSQWVSTGSINFWIVKVVDADRLWVMSAYSGNPLSWGTTAALPANSTLTHVAGATNTDPINYTTAGTVQIHPCVQRLTKTVKINGNQTLSSDGVYDCHYAVIEEDYDIANPGEMLNFIIAGRPWASEPALNDDSITSQTRLSYKHRIDYNGAQSTDGRFETLQTINLPGSGYVGFVQSQPISWLSSGNQEYLNYYVPRVNPIVGSVKTWNVRATEIIYPGTFEALNFVKAVWTDESNPPCRMAQFVTNPNTGVRKKGSVIGYSRLSGAGANLADWVIRSGNISAARKMYPHALTAQAPALGGVTNLPVGAVVEATAYRIPYNLETMPEATVAAVRPTDSGAEVILDFHENVSGYSIPVGNYLNGLPVSVIDGNGNLTLDSAVVSGGAITISVAGGYGEAVLRIGA